MLIGSQRLKIQEIGTNSFQINEPTGTKVVTNPEGKLLATTRQILRCVAQFGRARDLGSRSRRFESCHTDFAAMRAKPEIDCKLW